MKKIDTSLIVRLCLPQFAVGLFTTMLNNYLIYFYQPSKESGIPNLIPQGRIVLGILTIIGLIKAIGHIIDAVTDPLIAACSDKSRHPDGRRIPLMKKAAIPFGLCALLMFFVPLGKVSWLNAVWIAAFMWGYYFFFTLYMIPHNALIPELIRDGPLRVNAYTVSSFFFVTGSALGYVSPLIVSLFKGAGLATLWAWRTTFGIYTLIGIILLMIPACTIREKDYVHSVLPNVSLGVSLRHGRETLHRPLRRRDPLRAHRHRRPAVRIRARGKREHQHRQAPHRGRFLQTAAAKLRITRSARQCPGIYDPIKRASAVPTGHCGCFFTLRGTRTRRPPAHRRAAPERWSCSRRGSCCFSGRET